MNNPELLKRLCTASGISGDEGSVREIILSEISGYCDEIKVDNLGNIIAFKKGEKTPSKKLMLSAHMDEVGFIVTSITSDGLLKFEPVGGIDRRVIQGKSVKIGKNLIDGVVGIKPVHLTEGEEAKGVPKTDNMYIDIGAVSKENAAEYVKQGDSVIFEPFYENDGCHIKSKAIDDRAGCFILIELIKGQLPYDMYFTFAVQEEVGLRGAKTAAFTVEPDFALVLEATTAADILDVPLSKQVCNVGQGTVVSFMDRSTIYDKEMYSLAFDCAKEIGSKIQTKRVVAGGNDSGVIHSTKGGVRTLALSLACRYLHSPVSMVAISDIDNTLRLVKAMAEKICGGAL